MIKLFLDQGLPRSAAGLLRERGWDVQHVSERGMSRAEDATILLVARQEERVLVTLDADFHTLLAIAGQVARRCFAFACKDAKRNKQPR